LTTFRCNSGNLTDTDLGKKQQTRRNSHPRTNNCQTNERDILKGLKLNICLEAYQDQLGKMEKLKIGKMTDHDLFKAGNCSL